jgi:hypothetical protein
VWRDGRLMPDSAGWGRYQRRHALKRAAGPSP